MTAAVADISSDEAGTRHRRVSVRIYLVWLVLASLLPLFVLTAVLIWRDAAARQEAVSENLREVARNLRFALDREMQAAITVLETLRYAESLSTGDIERFTEVARAVKADHAHWIDIALTLPSGQHVMNLAAKPAPSTPGREVIEAVVRTRGPAVSELMTAQGDRALLVEIAVPVVLGGELKYVLGLSMPASYFQRMLTEQGPGRDWLAMIVDSRNVVVAQLQRRDDLIGKLANPLLQRKSSGAPAVFHAPSHEGVPLLAAIDRSDLSGWGVAVALPVATLNGPFERTLALLAAGGAFLLVASVAVAMAIGLRIIRPIEHLARSADAYVRGEAAQGVTPSSVDEVEMLADALKRAGEAQREAQAQSEMAQEALRQGQRLEAIGQLTGGVAHDFNNLLMVIYGNLQIIRRRIGSGMERQLAAIEEAANRGTSLTRQLLTFARRQALQPEVLDLREWMPKIEELLAHSLRDDIELRIDVTDDTHLVEVDPGELELALLNLAVNARDAMTTGGVLWISIQNAHPSMSSRHDLGESVAISVVDTGTGIQPDVLARVFEPFYTTKDVGKGTGLGLSQVYGFAKQSGGSVEIESEVGKGTTITLFLPCCEARQVSEASAASRKLGAMSGTILVVEDNTAVREVLVGFLSEVGYTVRQASDAPQALAELERDPTVDLMLTDIVMPGGVDGVELARRARMRCPRLPIVLTTGYSTVASAVIEEGFPILRKPYQFETLIEKLRDAARLSDAA